MPKPLVNIDIVVTSNTIAAIVKALPKNMAGVVDETAYAIRDLASALAPRDTGALAQSIYVSTPRGSDYNERASAASSLNSEANILAEAASEFILSLTGEDNPTYTDVVGVSVDYGVYQEFGTRHMGAQSFMTPAAENERGRFVSRMSDIAGR